MILTTRQKQDIVTRLKNSKSFQNSNTSCALLQYLFDSSLKGIHLKELLIDSELYGQNNEKETNNPRVRVNVYNLRKKIKDYYEEEGKKDKWKLCITKGQYHVSFERNKPYLFNFEDYTLKEGLTHFLLLCFFAYFVVMHFPPTKNKIWAPFLRSDQKTMVYVGDLFCTRGETITGNIGWTRDYSISNLEEFYQYIQLNPDMKNVLTPASFTITNSTSTLSIQRLQQYFQEHKSNFLIRFLTRTSTSEIKEGNAVYIGPIWNSNKFEPFFNEVNPYVTHKNKKLVIKGHPKIKDAIYDLSYKDGQDEFAIVSKYHATDATEHIVFMSQHEIGVIATVDYFTNSDSVKHFIDVYLQENEYFTAVFSVKGQDRSSTSLKLEKVVPF